MHQISDLDFDENWYMGKISSPPMANPAEDTAGGVALLLANPASKNFSTPTVKCTVLYCNASYSCRQMPFTIMQIELNFANVEKGAVPWGTETKSDATGMDDLHL